MVMRAQLKHAATQRAAPVPAVRRGPPQVGPPDRSCSVGPNVAVCCDSGLNVTAWPDSAATAFGYMPSEVLGQNLFGVLAGPAASGAASDLVERMITRRAGVHVPLNVWTKAGRLLRCEWTIAPIYDAAGCLEGFAGSALAPHMESQPADDVSHTIASFEDRVGGAIHLAQRCHLGVALLAVRADDRPDVIEQRLHSLFRQSDDVGRLSADAFGVVLIPVDGEQGALTAAHRLIRSWNRSWPPSSRSAPHVGIALHGEDGHDARSLIDRAKDALNDACATRQDVARFGETTSARNRTRSIEANLRRAVDCGELELVFQPMMSLRGATFAGARAAVRWRQANGQTIEDVRVVELARRSGLEPVIGSWMLSAACVAMRDWAENGVPVPRLHVDVLRGHCARRLVDDVANALCESDLDPAMLELGLRLDSTSDGLESVQWLLEELRLLGVRRTVHGVKLSYAEMDALEALHLDVVGIDERFVASCTQHDPSKAAIRAIVDIAHTMGMEVAADGVDTPEQAMCLRSLGCDHVRGAFVGAALPAAAFVRRIGGGLAFDPTG